MTHRPRLARLMVLPAAVLLLLLVGMALAAEPEPEQETTTGSGRTTEAQPEQRFGNDQLGTDQDDTQKPPSITIESKHGSIDVRFDSDGVARASVDDETEFDLVQGTGSGVRLGEERLLQPVPPAIIEDGDIGLTATDSGIEIQAPGSPPVELRPDGVNGGVSATEIDGDVMTTLTPEDGVVELADGTKIRPIEPPISSMTAVEPVPPMPWRWIFSIIAVTAVICAAIGYLLHRNYEEPDLRIAVPPTTTRADENFAQFLSRLAADESPTRAIRLGFHAVESGLGGLPTRRDDETPFEWHQRVSTTMPAMDQPLGRICDLFARARFAPGSATEDDRQHMINEIRTLVTGAHVLSPSEAGV